MIELTIGEIADITGASPIGGVDLQQPVQGPVEFDSRKVSQGSIFMALPGASVDGHDFVPKALESGAALALVGRTVDAPALVAEPVALSDEASNASAFEYDSEGHGAAVIAAIDALARYNTDHLKDKGMSVVAVTGSAGKTSTKDFLGSVLELAGDIVAPPGSFNNEIGLPYTALRATESTRFLVLEMSARGVGHIKHLTQVTPPNIGVVLNVGTAHLGEFGSREAIAQAKGELVEALPETGVAILNADDPKVLAMQERTTARVVTFSAEGRTDATYYAANVVLDDMTRPSFSLHHPDGVVDITLSVHGEHQVSNALAAIAVGMEAGLSAEDVARAVSGHTATSERRMDVKTRARDRVTVINDSYNANPESMRAGLHALAFTTSHRDNGHSWAVLGQMGELGDEATEEHEALGRAVAEFGIQNLVVVGTGVNQLALAEAADAAGVKTTTVESTDAAINYVDLEVQEDDVVLVKASYSDALWEVADGLLMGETIVDPGKDK
ncbi:UDP-N-acetylmuramoyl-tripeptide--D-alanyl-D-alanine ligase [Corynebacterium sp. zg254]|uniref:UDP-N-acetylmuramoyl-tripeptide--D-alanyl-D-alanine ligase n=1 Tax=Corynebacterium zhongnanshanii TaxID=2768834 RepID=A0ABQ6VDD7_9CORY|nr:MULTISPECIES: UDP-N-acetylmuramoyl-tripeptide--D-alanyl-D-alanine ligase [Corynebacterium]KAB3520821.1 UDP-N-acetylmuramoyl-tripeptide--D-alanyl-D-alanine ligase [Corynebacterium zhongnanshanii]MCR5914439.1 UDP-N-acetylmuramoyl-tripeptide--D-alanyl-D-alanine ligase [Corynebacterium sp. zg254]